MPFPVLILIQIFSDFDIVPVLFSKQIDVSLVSVIFRSKTGGWK